ncbi:hypothetical protein CTI12_AA358320 [Artemisia annua]|uniref:Uncharacterized protein n=1 Tax=Artemisia annua TaxID=35608 RepID=A0A2U1MP54_ARTAN|nr:hypothetical protein CTI12_AA358320 [Artemisia annua]
MASNGPEHEHTGEEETTAATEDEDPRTSIALIPYPTHKRAVNLSSMKPVSVQRNWLTTDIELTFAIVIKHDNEYINCNILVTCGVKQGGDEVNVSGVSLTILDMDGKCLNGKDSMVILQGLITAAKRQCNGGEGRSRARYDEYIQRRRERNEKTERRERRLDMACVASGVALVMAFWSFAIC